MCTHSDVCIYAHEHADVQVYLRTFSGMYSYVHRNTQACVCLCMCMHLL